MIEKMISNDMLAPLDYTNIPNSENIEAIYMKKSEVFDPGNKYSIPYQVGTAGIIYNKGMVGGEKIDSWEDLWDEKFADQMVMPDSVRDAFMIALRKHGYSQNTTDPKEIKTAAKDLIKQKPLVYKYANDSARDLLADGSAAVGVVWNGEYIYTKDLNEDVEFIIR
jgi:spermidine/putrescine-binding protein